MCGIFCLGKTVKENNSKGRNNVLKNQLQILEVKNIARVKFFCLGKTVKENNSKGCNNVLKNQLQILEVKNIEGMWKKCLSWKKILTYSISLDVTRVVN